jgi:hypothetical protein
VVESDETQAWVDEDNEANGEDAADGVEAEQDSSTEE